MTFGEKLREAREKKGYNGLKLAEKLNISKSAISQYETGARHPSYELLCRISEELGVSIDYLIGADTGRLKLRSMARLEATPLNEEEDRQVSSYIDFLISQRDGK